MLKNSCFIVLMFTFIASNAQNKIIPYNSTKIHYEGRILYRIDATELSWPGTSVTIRFKGRCISAILKDLDTANYYNVIVDDKFMF